MKKIIFTKEQEQDIIKQYLQDKKSMKSIGEKFGVSRAVISRVLKEHGISGIKNLHKYNADYKKFKIIDSPEKAYWLGFIAADGTVYLREENGSIILNISRKDKKHLEKFKNFMQSNVNIIDHVQIDGFSSSKGTEMSKITFNSKDMVLDFIDKGVPPKKSLILNKPNIKEEFYLPYILGYFDGDGSIYKLSQYNNYGINFVGTKELLTWINSILNIGKLEQKKGENKNNFYIRCGGTNKPYNIMKKLYDSCEVHLDRKFEIFKELEKVVY